MKKRSVKVLLSTFSAPWSPISGLVTITSLRQLAGPSPPAPEQISYVTSPPPSILSLPDLEDVREGVIASRIAAHAADIVKGVKGAFEWDRKMSIARKKLDWEEQAKLSSILKEAAKYMPRMLLPVPLAACAVNTAPWTWLANTWVLL